MPTMDASAIRNNVSPNAFSLTAFVGMPAGAGYRSCFRRMPRGGPDFIVLHRYLISEALRNARFSCGASDAYAN